MRLRLLQIRKLDCGIDAKNREERAVHDLLRIANLSTGMRQIVRWQLHAVKLCITVDPLMKKLQRMRELLAALVKIRQEYLGVRGQTFDIARN